MYYCSHRLVSNEWRTYLDGGHWPVHQAELEREIIVQIGRGKIPVSDDMFLDLIGAFIETTKVVLKYVNSWIYTKDHPELSKRGKR